MQGSEILVEALYREGIDQVFGLPGTTIMSVIDALARRDDMRYLSVRHEQVAAFMADGYARAAGRPAVALASRGPGAANMTIAVHNAHAESIPLIAIVGQIPDEYTYRDSFEETDLVSFFAPITKWAAEVHSPARLPELVQRAVRVATSGRPGPVLVSVPLDVQTAQAEVSFSPRVRTAPPAPDPTALDAAVDLLVGAERPVIIAGGGTLGRHYDDALPALASTLQAPVVTTWMRTNAIDHRSPFYCGPLGYGSPPETQQLVRDADVILALGCRFSEFTTQGYSLLSPETRLIQVDVQAEEIGHIYVPEIGIQADTRATTARMAAVIGVQTSEIDEATDARREQLVVHRKAYLDAVAEPPRESRSPVPSAEIVDMMRQLAARDDTILVQDVHTFGPWIARYVPLHRAGTYYAAAGGSMGWGLPASLGIALARPDERVIAVHGDGSFFMVAQDLETAVRENIPVVHVVVNNFAFGNTRDRQRFSFGERYLGVFYGNPDFAAFAELLGAHGERVEKTGELAGAVDRALATGRPAVVDVVQDSFEGLPGDLRPPGSN